ncbi:hypothetical protein FQZ97_898890 [compost metagenome]
MQLIKFDTDDALVELANDLFSIIVEETTDQYRDGSIFGIGINLFITGDISDAHSTFR